MRRCPAGIFKAYGMTERKNNPFLGLFFYAPCQALTAVPKGVGRVRAQSKKAGEFDS